MRGRYPYVVVTSFAKAKEQLRSNVGLIICNLDFGEHRMFDFLRYAKSDPQTSATPFLCIQSNEVSFAPILMQSIQISTRALGAEEMIPLANWRANLGEAAALEKLLARIDFYWEQRYLGAEPYG